MQININSGSKEFKNLGNYLKRKFNLKLTGLIRFLLENPDILEDINKKIPEEDINYRFRKKEN